MALNFPTSPTVGQKYTIGDTTWQWNGTAWVKLGTQASLTITETLLVTTSTNSTSTDTGALRVVGGVGVGGDTYIGGKVRILSTTESINTVTGALVVKGGVGVGGSMWIGGVLHMAGGYVLSTTTIAESLSSGVDISVVNAGGGTVKINNTSTLQSVTTRGNSTTNVVSFLNTSNSASDTTGAVRIAGGLGVAKDIYVSGNIYAVGEIVPGFSDRRLKTDVEIIDNSVYKVCQLSGVTYRPNELAEQFGYDPNQRMTGLFADEVEKILPEAVCPAPFDRNIEGISQDYKTVQYEKLVPLLVEAIKELKNELDDLKSKGCCGNCNRS